MVSHSNLIHMQWFTEMATMNDKSLKHNPYYASFKEILTTIDIRLLY